MLQTAWRAGRSWETLPEHGPGQRQVFMSVVVKCPPPTRCAGHSEERGDLACPDILETASESQAIYQGRLAPARTHTQNTRLLLVRSAASLTDSLRKSGSQSEDWPGMQLHDNLIPEDSLCFVWRQCWAERLDSAADIPPVYLPGFLSLDLK